jgi:hypothetical protein
MARDTARNVQSVVHPGPETPTVSFTRARGPLAGEPDRPAGGMDTPDHRVRAAVAMTREEVFAEATAVYDNYVAVLETGSVEALQAYARDLSERIIPRGVETQEVLGIILLLRDERGRS